MAEIFFFFVLRSKNRKCTNLENTNNPFQGDEQQPISRPVTFTLRARVRELHGNCIKSVPKSPDYNNNNNKDEDEDDDDDDYDDDRDESKDREK